MSRSILSYIGLLAWMFLSIQCSPERSDQETRPSGVNRNTCGQAQIDAWKLVSAADYEKALDRYREAIDLCQPNTQALARVLNGIAGIPRLEPAHCPDAYALLGEIPPLEESDYFRAAAYLHFVCSKPDEVSAVLQQFADLQAKELDATEPDLYQPIVFNIEYARLYYRAGAIADHLDSLKSATQLMCEPDVLPLAIRTMERETGRMYNPMGGTIGFWTVHSVDEMDQATRECLARAVEEMERGLDSFLPRFQRDIKGFLVWYPENFPEES